MGVVGTGNISAVFNGTANLEAKDEATVVAKISGVVKEILVEEGYYVRQGQILARLDDEQQKYKLNQAFANLNKLKSEYQRNEELFRKQLISADTYDKVKYDYESLKASYDLAELELKYAAIRAPINGVISERFVKTGNMITINEPTFKITDFDPLNALLYVPERHLSKLAKNQSVELAVDAIPGSRFTGHVERISPVVDPGSGTFKVTIEVRDPQRELKPGMFGRVNIVYDVHQSTLLVPKEAVITEDKQTSVFIIRGDTIAFRQKVTMGYTNTTHLEILNGLKEGDTVVTIGQASLKDRTKVQIIPKMAVN
ncbi:MAG: efflux RND transporter periplasmic adaptor subunit [Calditrichales bacterium]|nr:efflux RND transporter periplasmic adaptor subunit [Calditrichales bacterium]